MSNLQLCTVITNVFEIRRDPYTILALFLNLYVEPNTRSKTWRDHAKLTEDSLYSRRHDVSFFVSAFIYVRWNLFLMMT